LSMLNFKGVEHHYGKGTRIRLPDWQAAPGEHWLVLGPSGCGKSTLLHLAAGLLPASAGEVRINDVPLQSLSGRALDRFRARNVGVVFQSLHLVDALTVRQNLALAPYLAGLPVPQQRITGLLDTLGILSQAGAHPHQLSLGQAQRLAIARAVINRPGLILADEPTSALDDTNCERVIRLLLEQARDCGATLVIASHDSRLAAHLPLQLALEEAAA